MKSIKILGCNSEIGKDQPQYNTLYAIDLKDNVGSQIMCFELTEEEIAEIVKNKKLFVSQWTFGKSFQPMKITTKMEDMLDGYPLTTEQITDLNNEAPTT